MEGLGDVLLTDWLTPPPPRAFWEVTREWNVVADMVICVARDALVLVSKLDA